MFFVSNFIHHLPVYLIRSLYTSKYLPNLLFLFGFVLFRAYTSLHACTSTMEICLVESRLSNMYNIWIGLISEYFSKSNHHGQPSYVYVPSRNTSGNMYILINILSMWQVIYCLKHVNLL